MGIHISLELIPTRKKSTKSKMAAALVNSTETIASIFVAALGSAIAAATASKCFRRAFDSTQFLAPDLAVSHTRSRMQLLFFASVLTALDGLRSASYYSILLMLEDQSRIPQVQLYSRTIYLFTFVPAPALLTMACCQRCAVVAVHSPEWRRRSLRIALVICTVCVLCSVAGVIWVMLELIATNPAPAVWRATTYIPPSVSPVLASFPIVALVGTALALRVAFVDPANSSTSGSLHMSSANNPSPMSGTVSMRKSTDLTNGVSTVATTSTRKSLSTSGSNSGMQQQTRKLSGWKNRRVPLSARATGVRYHLSFAFKVLSVGIVCVWGVIMASIFSMTLGGIRTNSLVDLILALGVVIESMFERFIRARSRRAATCQSGTAHFETFADTAPQTILETRTHGDNLTEVPPVIDVDPLQ
ncbi:hypothetical protein BC828DRAFT_393669 [Blastocladiella britannica]|nr:hypothetical protein BC828DRAFT_393669 [Blastocladiella britannica]